jgi:hypothetical protein
MRRFLFALAALLFFCNHAFAASINGIWWNRSESGWGINFSQQNTTVFASMFVYRANNQPVWYVSTMQVSPNSAAAFSGDLFETTGPFFGVSPFNPANVVVRRVGTMNFTVNPGYAGVLSYTVDGVAVNKSIEPQQLASTPLAGNYNVTLAATAGNNCPTPNNPGLATRAILGTTSVQLLNAGGQVICSASGGYRENGALYTFVGTNPTCLTGTGSLVLLDLKGEGVIGVSNFPLLLTSAVVVQSTGQTCTSAYFMAGVAVN